jgi:hypothetical protein
MRRMLRAPAKPRPTNQGLSGAGRSSGLSKYLIKVHVPCGLRHLFLHHYASTETLAQHRGTIFRGSAQNASRPDERWPRHFQDEDKRRLSHLLHTTNLSGNCKTRRIYVVSQACGVSTRQNVGACEALIHPNRVRSLYRRYTRLALRLPMKTRDADHACISLALLGIQHPREGSSDISRRPALSVNPSPLLCYARQPLLSTCLLVPLIFWSFEMSSTHPP